MNIDSVRKEKDGEVLVGYILVTNGISIHVPKSEDNTHYQAIQEWVAEGNTIQEAN